MLIEVCQHTSLQRDCKDLLLIARHPMGRSRAGTKLKLEGRVDDGLAHYEEAIEICDTYGPAFYNVGVVHSEAKQVR